MDIKYKESREVHAVGGYAVASYSISRPLLPEDSYIEELYARAVEAYTEYVKVMAFSRAEREFGASEGGGFPTVRYLLDIYVSDMTEEYISIVVDSTVLRGIELSDCNRRAAVWSRSELAPVMLGELETLVGKKALSPKRRSRYYDGFYLSEGAPVFFKKLQIPFENHRIRHRELHFLTEKPGFAT